MTSLRTLTEPRVNVRPGTFVCAVPCHDADASARYTEDFFVVASHVGKYGLRLAGWSDVIPFSDDGKKVGAQLGAMPNLA